MFKLLPTTYILKGLLISIIFAKEAMGPSLTSSAPGSSRFFSSGVEKKLKLFIKRSIVDRFCWKLDRVWPGKFFDVLSLEKSLHYGPKIHFLWKFLILNFCQFAELSIWTLCGLIMYETWPFSRYKKTRWYLFWFRRFWVSNWATYI